MKYTALGKPEALRRITLLAVLLILIALVVNTSGAPMQAKAGAPYISPQVSMMLKTQGNARVIINLAVNNDIRNPAAFKSEIGSAQSMALFAMPAGTFTLTSQFKTIPALSGTITPDGLRAISSNPAVVSVNLDKAVSLTEVTSVGTRDDESDLLTRASELNALGYTGDGSRVAIIDTGIDNQHPSVVLLSDLIHQHCFRTEADCVGGDTSAEDQHSHGTHVAGIITGLYGVAPDAEFAALKVFTTGDTSDTNILNALDYVADNDGTLLTDFVNMSLGGGLYADQTSCDNDNGAYVASFAALNALGITVFVSTGNDYSTTGVSSPGCVTGAVGTGSVDDDFGVWDGHSAPDAVTSFSNATPLQGPGELVDILATGCAIRSEVPPDLNGGDEYDDYCGTSMASPTAAGVAAALLEFDPSLTPTEIEDLLEISGDLVVDDRAGMGNMLFPRVDAMNAYGSLVLEQPLGLDVTVISPTQMDLDWADGTGEAGYSIERSTDGVTFAEIGTVGANVIAFSDTDAPCGLVTYRVKATDGAGAYSLPSDPASDSARDCPAAPTDLIATLISDTQVDLEWTDNANDEDAYSIERRAPSETEFTEIDTTTGDTYSDTTVDCGLNEYRVRAYRMSDDSYSDYSNVAEATPCAPDNDLWVNAEVVSSDTYNDVEPNFPSATFSSTDPFFPCHFNGNVQAGESIWYAFTPSGDGNLTVDTVGSISGGNPDTILGIFTGAPGSFVMIACNDDINLGTDNWLSEIEDEPLDGGTTYYIIAANWISGSPNNIDEMHVNFSFEADGPTATPTDGGPTATPTDIGPTETPTEVPGTDLVVNGGFENLGSDGKPDLTPWVIKNSSGDKAKCNKDKDGDGIPDKIVSNTGDCAFQFKNVVGEAGKLEQTLDLSSVVPAVGDTLDLSVATQTKSGATAKVKVVIKYDDDTKTKITADITESLEYTTFTGTETLTGATITKAKLNIKSTSTSGKVYVDDVVLMHIPGSGLTGRGSLLPLPASSNNLGSSK